MSALRERLLSTATDAHLRERETFAEFQRRIALAAARMALDWALQECRPPNAYDQEDCANELRALRDGLE